MTELPSCALNASAITISHINTRFSVMAPLTSALKTVPTVFLPLPMLCCFLLPRARISANELRSLFSSRLRHRPPSLLMIVAWAWLRSTAGWGQFPHPRGAMTPVEYPDANSRRRPSRYGSDDDYSSNSLHDVCLGMCHLLRHYNKPVVEQTGRSRTM